MTVKIIQGVKGGVIEGMIDIIKHEFKEYHIIEDFWTDWFKEWMDEGIDIHQIKESIMDILWLHIRPHLDIILGEEANTDTFNNTFLQKEYTIMWNIALFLIDPSLYTFDKTVLNNNDNTEKNDNTNSKKGAEHVSKQVYMSLCELEH